MIITPYRIDNDPIVIKLENYRNMWEVGRLYTQGCHYYYERLARGIPTFEQAQDVARDIERKIAEGKYADADA